MDIFEDKRVEDNQRRENTLQAPAEFAPAGSVLEGAALADAQDLLDTANRLFNGKL